MVAAKHGGSLLVRYGGSTWSVEVGRPRVAGRGAHIDISHERAMHRRLVAFDRVEGHWFVVNLLEHKRVTLSGRYQGGPAERVLMPGEETSLPSGHFRLSFRIGTELRHLDLEVPQQDAGALPMVTGQPPESTAFVFDPKLSPVLQLLAVALAELRLLDPSTSSPLPTRTDVTSRLGWTERQYRNALDRLCSRLYACGVNGVVGDENDKALDRRQVVVDVLVENQVITADHLELLPPY